MAGTQEEDTPITPSSLGILSGLALNTLPAWAAWKVLENPREGTVLQPEFNLWLVVVTAAGAATLIGILLTFRIRRAFAWGLAIGVALAAVAVIVALYVDLVHSGGSITG